MKNRREIINEKKKKKERVKKTRKVFKKVTTILFLKSKEIINWLKILVKNIGLLFKNFGTYFKKIIGKFGVIILKKVKEVENSYFCFLKQIAKYKYQIILVGFLSFFIVNIFFQKNRLSEDENCVKTKIVNYWPTLLFSNVVFSRQAFECGYYNLSIDFFKKAEKVSKFSLFSKKLDELKKLVLEPVKKEDEYQKLSNLTKSYPYSWQIILYKAKLESELGKKEEKEKSLDLLKWINPNMYFKFLSAFEE